MGRKPDLFADRYEVLDLVAVAPTAAVYRANDRLLGHAVTLKILRKDLAGAALAVSRFRHDALLARRIAHPNVARVLDVGEHGGAHYVVRELVAGESLDVLLEAKSSLPQDRAARIALQLARALAAAHERGIAHCDLVPENIVVDSRGGVVLTDFGAARDRAGSAPELREGHAATERADLYTLGTLLYQMLTGAPPWGRRGGVASGAARHSVVPTRPHDFDPKIGVELSTLVMMLLEREPSKRPESARAVEATLTRIAPAAAAPSKPPTPPAPVPKPAPTSARTPSSRREPTSARPRRPRAVAVIVADDGVGKRRFVGDALASAIVDRMSAISSIRVLTPSADADERGEEDPRLAALRMGADVVLSGSLHLRASEDARFSVDLLSVESGELLWHAEIVRSLKELFKIADEVVTGAAHALDRQAAPPRSGVPEPDPSDVDPYLRARGRLAEYTKEASDDAERGLAAAFLRAPNDPALACWLALAKLQRWAFDPALGQGDEAAPVVAERIALEVLKRSPAAAEAHLVLATLADARGDAASAMRHARASVRSSPTLADAHALIGRLRVEANDVIAGERDLEVALGLSTHVVTLLALARTRGLLQDFERAAESLYLVDAKVPGHLGAALVRMEAAAWSLDPATAARARARALEVTATCTGTLVHAIRARAGLDVDRELGALTAVCATPGCTARSRAWLLQCICEVRAAAGDPAGAISALRDLDEAGSIDALWLESCPALAPLRALSGFSTARAAILARADLALDAPA